jgi:S-adenosylmethionine synthetase
LSRAYVEQRGTLLHHNVDEALQIWARSRTTVRARLRSAGDLRR